MQKEITRIVRDSNGAIVSGLTLTLFKHGDTTGGISAVEDTSSLGKYVFTIPDTYLSKYYDIRITDGSYNPYEENIEIEWEWIVENETVTNLQTLTYAGLTDIAGDALPTTIDNCTIDITHQADRLVSIYGDIDNTGFRVQVSSAGGDDSAVVTFKIKVGS